MRTIWKGAIHFGLVTIPVRLHSAVDEKSVKFNQLHAIDGGRIQYRRVCSVDGEEVPYSEIVKGYEYQPDRYVVLTDEELEAVAVPSSHTIEIERFVEADEIDPIYFQRSYYLVPEGTGTRGYALLREAMADRGKVAVCKVTFYDKEHLATLRLRDHALVLETMYWPDEIRPAAFERLDAQADVRPQEVRMARNLIESLTEPFDPEEFHDESRAAIEDLMQRKAQGEEITRVKAPKHTETMDLIDALHASVEAARANRETELGRARARRRKKAARGSAAHR
jgi:DNA end-binding protein Ku